METKPLLYGLIGFFIGGLLVSVAATTFDKPMPDIGSDISIHNMTMDEMSSILDGKSGDDYDKAFLAGMIAHHEGALKMAEGSAKNAKHQEIKELSAAIISAQKSEIDMMKRWQSEWGYNQDSSAHAH